MIIQDDGDYVTLAVHEDERLPIGVWTALVKLRADYRCQRCGRRAQAHGKHSVSIVSHHIQGDRQAGNHSLANGQCLCTLCHAFAHDELRKLRKREAERAAA
jgi:hypothetical protein